MEWEVKLIYIYCTVCHFFSQTPAHKKIRKSPNQILEFTDEEAITIFTGIQNASKVRSERGLVIHIFGRYAAALLLLVLQGKFAVL